MREVLPPWLRANKIALQPCLGLKTAKAGEVVKGYDMIVVKITVNGGRKKCPHRGSVKLCGDGMCDPRHVLHTWTNVTKVYPDLHRHRWKCRDCGHTFTKGKQSVHSRSRLTGQAEAGALWQLRDRNFSLAW